MSDNVDHPHHYNTHPDGIECIDVIKDMPFWKGCAIKYLWRCDDKGKKEEDLKKALWYIKEELANLACEELRLKFTERLDIALGNIGK